MECHRCKDRAEIEAGKYARVPYDKTPCAKCELKENSDYTLEYDQNKESRIQNPPSFAETTAGMESRMGNTGPQTDEELLPISIMSEVVVELLNMKPEIRDVVCWRFNGMSYRDIAALQGITMAGAELRHWKAMQKWPALRALFATKFARHGRRKPVSSGQMTVGRKGKLSKV